MTASPRALGARPDRRPHFLSVLAGVGLVACSGSPPPAGVAPPPPVAASAAASVAPTELVAPPPPRAQPVVLASGLTLRNRVAMAVDGSNVYLGDAEGRKLVKIALGGGSTATLAAATQLNGIAVDRANVYWTDGAILKLAAGGGTPIRLASEGTKVLGNLAVDTTSVYWTTWDGHSGSVMKMSSGGGKASTLASGFASPGDLVVDANAVYWTSWSADSSLSPSPTGDGAIMKVPIAGGPPVTLASAQPSPHFMTIDATSVYWNNTGPKASPSLRKVPIAGGAVTTLATDVYAAGVAVGGNRVYWSDYRAGTIMAVGIEGGDPIVVAAGQTPNAIAVDRDNVYWVNLGGTVMKVAKP